jgi:hypothetical protein
MLLQGELDYAITLARRAQSASTIIPDPPLKLGLPHPPQPKMPRSVDIFLRLPFHSFLLALCVFTLFTLWSQAPRVFFAIFLIWTLSYYVSMFVFAWHGYPQKSITAVIINRLRTAPSTFIPETAQPSTPDEQGVPFPTGSQGPYVHQPPHRAVLSSGPDEVLEGPRSVEADDDDDDDADEDTRQRRIEEEMARRDVSIVTVPRRKLWIANPS